MYYKMPFFQLTKIYVNVLEFTRQMQCNWWFGYKCNLITLDVCTISRTKTYHKHSGHEDFILDQINVGCAYLVFLDLVRSLYKALHY